MTPPPSASNSRPLERDALIVNARHGTISPGEIAIGVVIGARADVWDAAHQRLVLARDRFGIKPLYYRAVDGELAFASELRALPRGEIDLDALEAFLAFNSIPAPLTIFAEARKLPAGTLATWRDAFPTISTARSA